MPNQNPYDFSQSSDFEVRSDPAPPETASELMAQLGGADNVIGLLTPQERAAYAQDPNMVATQDANDSVAAGQASVDAYLQDPQAYLREEGYEPHEGPAVYQWLQNTLQQEAATLNQHWQNADAYLANFIQRNGLTQTVAERSGRYSSAPQAGTAAAAALESPNRRDRDRRDRRDRRERRDRNDRRDRDRRDRPPLGGTSGNQRRSAGR
ncbi:hypothetical protein [Streptomyces sp. NPDC050560]|uniref:hypothetical protein n=1 Tax=Streptomyces sp. NPDC050560 TaxID=3365630 RepID=UPI00379D9603